MQRPLSNGRALVLILFIEWRIDMEHYRVIGHKAEIHGGQVQLTDVQAAPRAHNLESLGKGLYNVTAPIQFKAGETFGYDGEFPKAMAEICMPADSVPAEESPAGDPKPSGPMAGDRPTSGSGKAKRSGKAKK
jgi:hypothetical protein